MRLIDADNYIGKVIASHCYSGVNKVIRIDDVPTVDVNDLIVEELEKIKKEFDDLQKAHHIWLIDKDDLIDECSDIIDNHISELKGEKE